MPSDFPVVDTFLPKISGLPRNSWMPRVYPRGVSRSLGPSIGLPYQRDYGVGFGSPCREKPKHPRNKSAGL